MGFLGESAPPASCLGVPVGAGARSPPEFLESQWPNPKREFLSFASHRSAALREKCGLTQAALAEKVGTTQAGISRLENPNYQNYSLKPREKVVNALGARLKVELDQTQSAARIQPQV